MIVYNFPTTATKHRKQIVAKSERNIWYVNLLRNEHVFYFVIRRIKKEKKAKETCGIRLKMWREMQIILHIIWFNCVSPPNVVILHLITIKLLFLFECIKCCGARSIWIAAKSTTIQQIIKRQKKCTKLISILDRDLIFASVLPPKMKMSSTERLYSIQ